MKIRFLLLFFITYSAVTSAAWAQSPIENILKGMATEVDYLINAQESAALYERTTTDFQSQLSASQFEKIMSQVYSLGKIESWQLDSLIAKDKKGVFSLEFKETALEMIMGVEEDGSINYLTFAPKEKRIQKEIIEDDPASVQDIRDKDQSPLLETIESLAKTFVQKHASSELAIGLLHDNQIHRLVFLNEEGKTRSTDDTETLFELGGLSHLFVATLAARLAQEESLDLDETISSYLPDSVQSNPSLKQITFRNLADYSTGFPSLEMAHPDIKENVAWYQKLSYKDIFTFLKNINIKEEEYPISSFNYLDYALLTTVLEKQQEKSFTSLLEELVFNELNMEDTHFLKDIKSEKLSSVYKEGKEVKRLQFEALNNSLGLQSSLEDLISFARAQLLFPESTLQKGMTLTREFSNFDEDNQVVGLGWLSNMNEGIVYYFGKGKMEGSGALISVIPDTKSALIILSNTQMDAHSFAQPIIEKIMKE